MHLVTIFFIFVILNNGTLRVKIILYAIGKGCVKNTIIVKDPLHSDFRGDAFYRSIGKPMKNTRESKSSLSSGKSHGRIIAIQEGDECLDTTQLNRLEQSFREWLDSSRSDDMRFSRLRILIIFLLIRYTAAKLNEVLALNPFKDMDWNRQAVLFRGNETGTGIEPREVQISKTLSMEIREILKDPAFHKTPETLLNLDPGFVRRKFYERTRACGFLKRLGGPEMIRKARAVELMQGNMPLPAVQMLLGHKTPNLTSSYVSFSRDEIRKVAELFMEKESLRKTSARNAFFGKIQNIQKGDIQTRVELMTMDGFPIFTVITNDSVERLGLSKGRLIAAEVKAPWVCLHTNTMAPACSSDNKIQGVLEKITQGKINTECVVRVSDTTELCAVIATAECKNLKLKKGDKIWALFNGFSVVLHAD